jgi:hypothetical protein
MAYLSVCSIYRDDADYLAEWVEFHRLVGVERFFLYNNFSTDDHLEVLAPYIEEGLVVVDDWPVNFPEALTTAFNDCLSRHREASRWIAFIDVDEFLFSPTGRPVSEVLKEYEEWPAVVANWAMYGTSGHIEKPPGLQIENFLRRSDQPIRNTHIKCIVDPSRTLRCMHPHHFEYDAGVAVDENHTPLDGWVTDSVSFSKLRINHYWSRSESECRKKFDLWNTTDTPREWIFFERRRESLDEVYDDTITRYLPDLRAALRRRQRDRTAARSRA